MGFLRPAGGGRLSFKLEDRIGGATSTTERYRSRLVLVTLAAALLVPFVFFMDDFASGRGFARVGYYAGLAFVLTAAAFVGALFRRAPFMPALVVALSAVGYFCALYLPHMRRIYVLIFICYPLLAFQLLGTRAGGAAVAGFLAAVVAAFALSSAGILPPGYYPESAATSFAAFCAYCVQSLLALLGIVQFEVFVRELNKKAAFDEQTGLPNRAALVRAIEKGAVKRLYVLRFENFTDMRLALGDAASEDLFRNFASRIREEADKRAFLPYKLRGYDFCLAVSPEVADRFDYLDEAYRLAAALGAIDLVAGKHRLRAFVRICAVDAEARTAAEILSAADAGLRAARKLNARLSFGDDGNEAATVAAEKGRLYSILAENVEKGQLRAAFQPIVDAKDGSTILYELLLRVRLPDGSYSTPLPFLDIAEATGFDEAISTFVLCEAEAMLERTDLLVSINVGVNDVQNAAFLESVSSMMARDPSKRGRLVLEILERNDPSQDRSIASFIDKAHELGCLVAIDDFGAGYANFMSLLTIKTDIVKLEGSLVRTILKDDRARGLVEDVISFCRRAGTRVVAEHVDKSELAETLKGLGADYLQGYFYGMPELAQAPTERAMGTARACLN